MENNLNSGIINKEIFENEFDLCKKLSLENGGFCLWGECDKCGVLPLLVKLYKGELIHKKEDLEKLRDFGI
ncbi:MAG: hypothetical protein PHF46_02165 [Candidatus Gracilibacteria bacterium]|nr:hypothetical protein [Candidatus Gracilibacteria bacterium]MDD3120187.1 hypothetical protein [Candidatus Gracilibacteria bacterium]MDD4531079.1 hypothetical protein [Candidatus Gracilibacteria bacterium]